MIEIYKKDEKITNLYCFLSSIQWWLRFYEWWRLVIFSFFSHISIMSSLNNKKTQVSASDTHEDLYFHSFTHPTLSLLSSSTVSQYICQSRPSTWYWWHRQREQDGHWHLNWILNYWHSAACMLLDYKPWSWLVFLVFSFTFFADICLFKILIIDYWKDMAL